MHKIKNNSMSVQSKMIAIYFAVVILFGLIAGHNFYYKEAITEMPEGQSVVGELLAGDTLSEEFTNTVEDLWEIKLYIATYSRKNQDTVKISIVDEAGQIVCETVEDTDNWEDNSVVTITLDKTYKMVSGNKYTIVIESLKGTAENSITLYKDNQGKLCYQLKGSDVKRLTAYLYWPVVVVIGLALIGLCAYDRILVNKGKRTAIRREIEGLRRYKFLMKQLVARDFKTKYKRSVLGAFWSFLNPLLTMMVQYVVFSTLFRSNIENYPVYLLSGIILFNFFTEAVGLGLTSIVSNASLITKVHVPKYIYPISRVLSTSINLLISIIPLLLVTLITGIIPNLQLILMVFALLCLLIFSMGITFILATAMTFFRDTQFLWSIISMIWVYATPIFYPAEIVPAKFEFIQTLNPMYHIITFVRTVIINGVSPEPMLYVYCAGSSLAMLLLGVLIFKKFENRFVLYI